MILSCHFIQPPIVYAYPLTCGKAGGHIPERHSTLKRSQLGIGYPLPKMHILIISGEV